MRDKAFPEFGLSVAVSCDDEIVRPYKGKDSPFAVLADGVYVGVCLELLESETCHSGDD